MKKRDSFAMTRDMYQILMKLDAAEFNDVMHGIFFYALNGSTSPLHNPTLEAQDAFDRLKIKVKHRMDKYDMLVDNGKHGHLGAQYGHLGGRPRKTPMENPHEIEEISEKNLKNVLAQLAFDPDKPDFRAIKTLLKMSQEENNKVQKEKEEIMALLNKRYSQRVIHFERVGCTPRQWFLDEVERLEKRLAELNEIELNSGKGEK
ncbi:MAG: hypothetical protein FWE31_04260 [Firmicutes bacterium]|nr:hypothetical protein [Bacillota bacterium]